MKSPELHILERIEALRAELARPVVVALDGGSGSGKSTIAARLAKLTDIALVTLDDFYQTQVPESEWPHKTVAERLNRKHPSSHAGERRARDVERPYDEGGAGSGGLLTSLDFGLAQPLPLPREHFMETRGREICDVGKDIGEPGLRVHVIQPCGHDEGEHDGGTVCAALGTGEEPCLSAASYAAQRSFRGIVRHAGSAVVRIGAPWESLQ